MSIQFEGHKGTLDIYTNEVIFYGMTFSDILEATKYLKKLPVGNDYVPWYYRGHKGFMDQEDGSIFLYDRWLPDADFAENFIKAKGSKYGRH